MSPPPFKPPPPPPHRGKVPMLTKEIYSADRALPSNDVSVFPPSSPPPSTSFNLPYYLHSAACRSRKDPKSPPLISPLAWSCCRFSIVFPSPTNPFREHPMNSDPQRAPSPRSLPKLFLRSRSEEGSVLRWARFLPLEKISPPPPPPLKIRLE